MAKQKPAPRDPDLLGRLWNDLVLSFRLMLDRRVGGGTKLIPLAMLLYLLSPIDLIPDLLLPFGVMDDLTVAVLALQLFIHNAPRDVVNAYRGIHPPAAPGTAERVNGDYPQVIEGHFEVIDDSDHTARRR